MGHSAITIESVHRAYLENADYDEVGSIEKAKKFVTAVRRMMSFAQSSANQSSSLSFDLATLQRERQQAEAYIAVNDDSIGGSVNGGMNCFGFEGYQR